MKQIIIISAITVLVSLTGCAPSMKDFPKLQQSIVTEHNPESRQKLIEKVGKIKEATPEVHLFLQETLANDKVPSVRQESINSLVTLNAVSSVSSVKKALSGDSSPEVRNSAVKALYSLEGNGSFASLKTALQDEDARVRLTSVTYLAQIGGAEAADLIAERLQKDADPSVRGGAASVVVTAGHSNSFELLKSAALTDSSTSVKEAAVNAIGTIPGNESVTFLGKCLKDTALKEAALTSLSINRRGHDSPEIITCILDMLQNENGVDNRKISILLASDDGRVDPALLKVILTSYDENATNQIIDAYKNKGNYSLVPPLANALTSASSQEHKLCLIRALGSFGDNRAVPALLTLTRSSDGSLATNAVTALGNMRIGDMDVWNNLCGIYKTTSDKDMRFCSGDALFHYYHSARWVNTPQVCERK